MFLFAMAGVAAGLGEEEVLRYCGAFVILPAVILLILVAWVADAPWAGWTALAVAGLTYLGASWLVANYRPSDDFEVSEEQASGRRLVEQVGWLAVAAGVSLMAVGARRIVRCLWPHSPLNRRRANDAERLAVVAKMESRGLFSADEAAKLRRKLLSSGAKSQNAAPGPAHE